MEFYDDEDIDPSSQDIKFCIYEELNFLPKNIVNRILLKEIYCEHNQIIVLPYNIGILSCLKILNCSYNILTAFPDSIGNLSSLTDLWCGNNKLTSLPENIGDLTSLKVFSCHTNHLLSLPASIGNLTSLEWFNCSHNRITSFPESTGKLSKITQFRYNDNELTSLPGSMLRLKKLTPSLFSFSNPWKTKNEFKRGQLPSLRSLMLEYVATNMKDRSMWPIEELYIPEEILEDLDKIELVGKRCWMCEKILKDEVISEIVMQEYDFYGVLPFCFNYCDRCSLKI